MNQYQQQKLVAEILEPHLKSGSNAHVLARQIVRRVRDDLIEEQLGNLTRLLAGDVAFPEDVSDD